LQQPYTLKVIDVQKHPDLAEADQVAATPTLMRVWPLPVKRIVGELEDAQAILRILTAER
jgi:circadian clock protein KaiB